MSTGMRSSMSLSLLHDSAASCADYAADSAAFGNYCYFGAAQKHLSPAALQTNPVDLPILLYKNMYAACSSSFFVAQGILCLQAVHFCTAACEVTLTEYPMTHNY
jgi:hypothetical protein